MQKRRSSSQPYLIAGTETLSDRLNYLGCTCFSWVTSCLSPSETEESSSDLTWLIGSCEKLKLLSLRICWTVWSSILRLVLRLWLCLQHWIFIKDHIFAKKGTLFLYISKLVCLGFLGETDEIAPLWLGLQFVPFLTINQTVCQTIEYS